MVKFLHNSEQNEKSSHVHQKAWKAWIGFCLWYKKNTTPDWGGLNPSEVEPYKERKYAEHNIPYQKKIRDIS